jgi:hypothetical protein
MAKRLGTVTGFSMVALLLAAAPALASTQAPSGHASRTSRTAGAHDVRAVSPLRPSTGPALPDLAVYAKTGLTSLCMAVSGALINQDWSVNGCRNVDESIFNNSTVAVRLYFSPGHGGAWTCLPMHWSGNVTSSNDKFNSGSGAGAGHTIENNVASSQLSTSNDCSKPIGDNN